MCVGTSLGSAPTLAPVCFIISRLQSESDMMLGFVIIQMDTKTVLLHFVSVQCF